MCITILPSLPKPREKNKGSNKRGRMAFKRKMSSPRIGVEFLEKIEKDLMKSYFLNLSQALSIRASRI